MSKKSTNKKEKKQKNGQTTETAKKSWRNYLLILISLLIGFSSYYLYNVLVRSPDPPKLDLDFYWGHYPMDQNQNLTIRPYKIEFSDVMIHDLKERLLHTRPFPPPLENTGFTYGFNSKFLSRVLDYWQRSYDFKHREIFFNQYNHFITNIQGLDIHFVHVKPQVSSDVKVLPLLMMHGWPGSFREFYEIIPKLTSLRPGYDFVFEIIAPSLPGYGYSQAASRPGLGPAEIAVLMRNLMTRIGHDRYYIQGGDWGHAVASSMATLFPENILGFHTNTPIILLNPMATLYTLVGSLWPNLIETPELQGRMYPLSEKFAFAMEESGYLHLQATKPDTIGIALTDSPAGLAAYILEKFSTWTNPEFRKASDGNLTAYTMTYLLDMVMVYWASNSITTSMRLYSEAMSRKQMEYKMDQITTLVPTWGIKFKHELLYQPDCILKLKFKNYLHSTVVEDGGHFGAFEKPDIMADDIFEAVDAFSQFYSTKGHTPEAAASGERTIYEFTVRDIHGNDVKLDKYKGHVLIIVNVASQCGLTETNYNELNQLYEKYSATKGLRILAFPCDQFLNQEPGSSSDILQFTKQRGVKFDIFEKVNVNGGDAHPLWQFLKTSQSGLVADTIKWNFSKFIIDKNGVPVERFSPTTNPLSMETHLEKYW